jgi:hypothetical protein
MYGPDISSETTAAFLVSVMRYMVLYFGVERSKLATNNLFDQLEQHLLRCRSHTNVAAESASL